MNLLTLAAKPWLLIIVLAVAFSAGSTAGWFVTNSVKSTEIALIKVERLTEAKAQTDAAIKDLKEASAKINLAASGNQTDVSTLNTKLDGITKELKNVQKLKPLPPDCRPTADRVSNLANAVRAANEARTSPKPSH